MAPRGKNKRDLPQLMNPAFALNLQNYLPIAQGQLEKRKGLNKLLEVAGTDSITMTEEFTSDIIFFGFGTTLSAYTISTNTVTNIKTDFSANDGFDGTKYGDYFFVCNGVEKIHRISRTLTYGTQTANFTVGAKITGATSAATAVILEDSDSGATGTLTLGSVTGTFQSGEIITDDDAGVGSATTTSVLTFTATEISASPVCSILTSIESRLMAGRLKEDPTAVKYPAIDDGTNPPFTDWTVTLLADGAGQVNYRKAGQVNAIIPFGKFIVIFHENGKTAFFINTIDSAGTLTRLDVFQMARDDFGGATGAILTNEGAFYLNEAGAWQMVSVGQENLPFSTQEATITTFLGNKFFDNTTQTNTDLAYDAKKRLVLVTYAKNSAINNRVLAYNLDLKAQAEITGWNINRFLNIGQTIFGGSSINTKLYELFSGNSDDGLPIGTDFLQEIRAGQLETRQDALLFYIQGFLSPSSVIKIRFDTYTRDGKLIKDKKRYDWTTQRSESGFDGYSSARYGSSSYGGDEDFANTVESFDGIKLFIRNWQRIRIHITSADELPHVINWFSIESRIKAKIRRRKLTLLT